MNTIFIILLVIYIAAYIWLAYEIATAPLMPDDYDLDFEIDDEDECSEGEKNIENNGPDMDFD